MYEKRYGRLNDVLQEMNCEWAFIVSPVHIHYYSGFQSDPHERFFALLFDTNKNRTYLFLPELDYEKAKLRANVDDIIPVSDTDDGYEVVKQTIGTDVKSVAIEKNVMTVFNLEQLRSTFSNIKIESIDSFIAKERMRKSKAEIEQTKKAIEITEQGLAHIVNFVQVGMTEIEIKMELEFYLQSLGAEKMAFDTLVLTGENSALPHGVSGLRKVQKGDFLLFDFGVTVNGYHSDITRTFIIDSGTQEQQNIYETVKEANERAIQAAKEGNQVKHIDIVAREYIESHNYGKFFTHRTGHGLGLEVHEEPSIHAKNELVISKGMLFTIEPGIYIPSIGGVRIEDNIYINETGQTEVLTTYSKALTYIEG